MPAVFGLCAPHGCAIPNLELYSKNDRTNYLAAPIDDARVRPAPTAWTTLCYSSARGGARLRAIWLGGEIAIFRNVAPVAVSAVEVEEEEDEAKRRARKDDERRPRAPQRERFRIAGREALVHRHRQDADGRLGAVRAVLCPERDTRLEDEADGGGVHAHEGAAHPLMPSQRLAQGEGRGVT